MWNIVPMSHAGNWHRTPGKVEREARAAREVAEAMSAEPTREIVFEASNPNLLTLHPCASQRQKFHVVARCTCGARKSVDFEPLLASHLAHALWPRVMRHMVCEACGGQPIELAFSLPVGQVNTQMPAGTIRVRVVGGE